jgi:hypothetical protein
MPDKIKKKEAAFLAGLALESETPELAKRKLLCLAKKHHSTQRNRIRLLTMLMVFAYETTLENGEKPIFTSTELPVAQNAALQVWTISTRMQHPCLEQQGSIFRLRPYLQLLKVLVEQGKEGGVGLSFRRHVQYYLAAEAGISQTGDVASEGDEGVLEFTGIKPYQSRGWPVHIGNSDVGTRFQGVNKSFLAAPGSFGNTGELPLVLAEKCDQAI